MFNFSRFKSFFSSRLPDGLLPIDSYSPNDVFIVGYPKSGNVWMQYMMMSIIFGLNPESVSDTLVQDLVPCVHVRSWYRRYGSSVYFRSHSLPDPRYKTVIYLVRDGRDVMVSYLHHLQALERREIDFLKLAQTGEGLFLAKWHEHVESWLANPYQSKIILVKYEVLKSDTVCELKRICDFTGLKPSDETLDRVAVQASFEALRRREAQFGWDNSQWPKDKPFVRRGAVGSYQDEMPPDVLAAFLTEANETLEKLGYLTPEPAVSP